MNTFLSYPSVRFPWLAVLLASDLMGFFSGSLTSNSTDFRWKSGMCSVGSIDLDTLFYWEKRTLLFHRPQIVDLQRRRPEPDLLVVCSRKMQRTKLGTLTYFAWITDRIGDDGRAARFRRSLRSYREKNQFLPVRHMVSCHFLHRDLDSS